MLSQIDMVRVNDWVLAAAGALLPVDLRALDAIRLATALQLGHDLGHLVTCDECMRDHALQLGLSLRPENSEAGRARSEPCKRRSPLCSPSM